MSLKAYQYQLPFSIPLVTSTHRFENRDGIIIEYQSGEHSFFGEAAPLPGFSRESLDDVVYILKDLYPKITDCLENEFPVKSLISLYANHDLPPSLCFALDTIAYQMAAADKETSLPDILFEESRNQLLINAIGHLLGDQPIKEVEGFVKQGFGTIKFKVGRSFDTELKQLQNIRSQFPDITIRLDANQAWDLDHAQTYCEQLSELDIEYCEEPLREPSPKNMEQLHRDTTLPLAIDESLIQTDWWPNLLSFTSHIIIKPMLLGSFTNIFETNRLANTHDNKTVFTTSLESGIGRMVTAILAAGLGSPNTAHGLNTGRLLAKDLYLDFDYILEGKYQLPEPNNQLRITAQQLEKLSAIKIQQ